MANPPVCRIMDYGKFRYEEAQKAKESRRKSTNVSIKEVKFRPKIGRGDFDVKVRKVDEFVHEGHKVKVTLQFRGREMAHPELGDEDPRPGPRRRRADRQGREPGSPRGPEHVDGPVARTGRRSSARATGEVPMRCRAAHDRPAADDPRPAPAAEPSSLTSPLRKVQPCRR